MKRIIALILMLSCVLTVASCAVVPLYDSSDLVVILKENGYTVKETFKNVREGVVGYVYAHRIRTGDELYYIYCEDFASANSIYDYVNSKQKTHIAEIKMEIDQIEYALYKTEGLSAEEKGRYYQRLIEKQEELEEVKNYTCGRGLNVVWYGTKQAVLDIKGITDKLGK